MNNQKPTNKERLAIIKALAKAIATDAQDIASDSPTYPQAHQDMGEEIGERADEIIREATQLARLNHDPEHVAKYYKALRRASECYSDLEGFLDCIDDPHPSVTKRREAMDKALDAAFAILTPKE